MAQLGTAAIVAIICAACLLSYLLPLRFRYLWLLVCSCGFYVWSGRGFPLQTPSALQRLGFADTMPAWLPPLTILLFVAAISYLCALLIDTVRAKPLRVFFLFFGVLACLGLWAACKYMGLLAPLRLHVGGIVTDGSANGFAGIALPLGLSIYTVQAAGYLADVFTHRAKAERNPLLYTSFLSFFPALFMGPIARAGQMLPQFRAPHRFSYNRFTGGLFLMLWGLVKKLIVADKLSFFTKYVFGATLLNTAPVLVVACLLFTLQVYMDFSGCCDIVVGFARLLGFDFAENFVRPFSATSFAGLWQRWNLSLGGLLRDCVYTPLVQSRWPGRLPGIGRFLRWRPAITAGALTFVMFAAWHGLQSDYLLWGLVTGVLFGISQLLAPVRGRLAARVPIYRIPAVRGFFQRVFVYLLFTLTTAIFASALFEQPFLEWFEFLFKGWDMLGTGDFLASLSRAGLTGVRALITGAGTLLVLGVEHFAIDTENNVATWIRIRPFYVRWPLYYLLVAALLFWGVFPGTAGMFQQF